MFGIERLIKWNASFSIVISWTQTVCKFLFHVCPVISVRKTVNHTFVNRSFTVKIFLKHIVNYYLTVNLIFIGVV